MDRYFDYWRSINPIDEDEIKRRCDNLLVECLTRYKNHFENEPTLKDFIKNSYHKILDLSIKIETIKNAKGRYKNRYRRMKPYLNDLKFITFDLGSKFMELEMKERLQKGNIFANFAEDE
jgi:hypothetical protein